MAFGSYRIGSVFGIPIRVHVTLLIVLPLIALQFSRALGVPSILWGIVTATGLFASVVVHELAHSLVAISKGCRVREILLLPIGGVAQMNEIPTKPRDEVLVAAAGPGSSLGLGVLLFMGAAVLARTGLLIPAAVTSFLGSINIMLVVFNLLPSFPMDGGRIFRAWLTPRLGRLAATAIAAKTGRFMAVLFGIYGLFKGNLFLVVIAIFIYQAAGAEYRMVRMQETVRGTRPFWMPPGMWSGQDEIVVSPPPYRRKDAASMFANQVKTQQQLFDELFEKWR